MGIVHIDNVPDDQASNPISGGPPPQVVPGGDGAEGARVVIETGGIVKPCCFHDLVEVARHAVQAVVENHQGGPSFSAG